MERRYAVQHAAPPDCAKRIKALRVTYDLTQTQLADLLGVSYAAISRWEHGAARPSPQLWQSIARIEQDGPEAFAGGYRRASTGVSGVREASGSYAARLSKGAPPFAPFTAAPEDVRLAVEAHRLEYGYLVNPAFATEVSLIEPLPHQRIAVYERMLPESRLRDCGALLDPGDQCPLREARAGPVGEQRARPRVGL